MSTGTGADPNSRSDAGRRHRTTWLVVFTLILVGIAGYSIRRSRGNPDAARSVDNRAPAARYVGDQACKTCHREMYDRYQQTGMARSWRSIESLDLAHFGADDSVHHPASGFSYSASNSDGRPQVIESRPESPGSPPHQLAREVHFAVGSGNRAQAYAIDTGGYLTLAPINWYTGEQKWDLNPGYAEYNHRFDRRVLAECVACHQGRPHRLPGSGNRYEMPIASGIGCETCHGPGERHVAEQSSDTSGIAAAPTDSQSMVKIGGLEPARQNDVCFSCHVAADVRWSRTARSGEDFRPGQRLADFRADFFVTPDDPSAVGVASHGARMVQSRCFTESGGQLTCIGCHDPHVPAAATPRATYDAACARCHARNDCPQSSRANEAEFSCTRCHMPAVPASNAPHVVFTEHWIRPRPASRSTDVRVAKKPKRAAGQPVELSDFWSSEPSDLELGIAYVAYFDETPEHRQRQDMEYGLKLIAAARARATAWPAEADFWLGIGRGHQRDWQRAAEALDKCAARAEDPQLAANALARLAQAYEQMGRSADAVAAYRELMRRYPDCLEAYEGLLPLLIQQRQLEEAISLAQRSLERNADQPAVLARLALALVRRDRRPAEPLARLAAAELLNPDLTIVYLTRAAVFEASGNGREASRSHRDALCAMARAAVAAGDRTRAADFIRQALQRSPGDSTLLDWLNELNQAAPGNPDPR
jgi:tetratricopeptide (TPR) repeat protein